MNIFDILILVFVILGALEGYRRGIISGLISFGASLLGFIFAAKEYIKVLGWLDQYTPLRQWLEPIIYKMVLPSVEAQAQATQQQTLDRILAVIPQELRNLLGSEAAPDFQTYTQNAIQGIAENMTGVFTESVMKILAFVLTYTLILLILNALTALILAPVQRITGTLNRGGGFILGGLGAFIGLSVFVGFIAPLITLAGQDTPWGLLLEAQTYPLLVQTFDTLVRVFRLNLDQALSIPLDLTEIKWPNSLLK